MKSDSASHPLVWWMIWAALLAAVVVYAVLPRLAGMETGPAGDWAGLRAPFLVAGLAAAALALGLRFVLVPRLIEKGGIPAAFACHIAACALAELPAVLGLVLAMLGAPQKEWLPLTVLGFGALLLLAPTIAARIADRGDAPTIPGANRVD